MTGTAVAEAQPRSVLMDMAFRYGMEPKAFEATVRSTCIKPDRQGREASREEFAAFLLVAKEYGLNPLTKEIYAFRDQRGGIMPLVSVDGWANIINSHPAYNGMDFDDVFDERGKILSVSCRMHRKDRDHPTVVTEYLAECSRDTEPWKKWPVRMLRHKAMIQAARYAFGFAGIYDPDEAERIASARDITPRQSTLQSRLSGPIGQGFSRQHVEAEMGDAPAAEVEDGREVDQQQDDPREDGAAPEQRQAPQEVLQQDDAGDPDAERGEETTVAYREGREARRQRVSRKAVPGGYRDNPDDVEDWLAGWDEEDKALKGDAP